MYLLIQSEIFRQSSKCFGREIGDDDVNLVNETSKIYKINFFFIFSLKSFIFLLIPFNSIFLCVLIQSEIFKQSNKCFGREIGDDDVNLVNETSKIYKINFFFHFFTQIFHFSFNSLQFYFFVFVLFIKQRVLRTFSRRYLFFSKQVLLKTFRLRLINHRYTRLEGCCLFFPFLHIFDNYLF